MKFRPQTENRETILKENIGTVPVPFLIIKKLKSDGAKKTKYPGYCIILIGESPSPLA